MDTGTIRLGTFEAQYEQLVTEALDQDSLISTEERERLNMAASALGLDPDRAERLEAALRAANRARARDTLVDPIELGSISDDTTGRGRALSISDAEVDLDADTFETPIAQPAAAIYMPRATEDELHQRFLARGRTGEIDAQFCTAAVLVHKGQATRGERELYDAYRVTTPPRPRRALTTHGWSLLFHDEEDRLTGEIFAVIAPAALIGRVSAMRADKTLPRLDPKARHDPSSSTVSAVRALAWSAATMGLQAPPIYVEPDSDGAFDVVTFVPPSTRVGKRMLVGQSALKLAFHSARHLTWFREERFVCTLVPTMADLGDLFVAALTLGAPEFDLRSDVRARTALIAEAIAPVLEPLQQRRLRELVGRFIAQGGRTSLQDWARAAGWTACRAGLLLCGDLEVACEVVASEPSGAERVIELQRFWASDQAVELRAELGVGVGTSQS